MFIQLLEKSRQPHQQLAGDETPKANQRGVQVAYNIYYKLLRYGFLNGCKLSK